MPDETVSENFLLISQSIDLITNRLSKMKQSDDFVSTEHGVFVFDSIAMKLQVVGELLKRIDYKDRSLLDNYPEMMWKNIMRFRDIVSHHYKEVEHEIIFDICKNHLL